MPRGCGLVLGRASLDATRMWADARGSSLAVPRGSSLGVLEENVGSVYSVV